MEDLASIFINEEFDAATVTPAQLDRLLADGWRHFGPQFFRYNLALHENEIRFVVPLRVRLAEFEASKSQRRVLRRNEDASVEIGPVAIDGEVEALFRRHRERFRHNPPDSIYSFISPDPSLEPCELLQITVRDGNGHLAAVSFFDLGERAISGIYAMFQPSAERRRLGIFTMLKEMEYAAAAGKEFYYQGYCYSGKSFYDYKKQFRGTEAYRWNGLWEPLPRNCDDGLPAGPWGI